MTKNKIQKNIVMKKSGIDWIGDIPSGWDMLPMRASLKERKNKNIGNKVSNILSVMKDVGVVRYEDKGNVGNKSSSRPEAYKIVQPNDIVANSMNLVIGSVGISRELGVTSSVYLIYYAKDKKVDINFFEYLFRTRPFQKHLALYGRGIMELRESIKQQDIKVQLVPTPPKQTQQKIVKFLDKKTEAVAELVAKKKKMIELLKEKRSAVITQAVTKGLEENVQMKDSGVDWIGDIPSGWEVKKLKFLFKNIIGKRKFHNQIALENIESWTGKYIKTENEYTGYGTPFNKEDILFGKLRPYLAKVLITEGCGEAGGDILVFRVKDEILSNFGHKMLLSKNVIDYINASTYGTKMPRVNPDFIRSLQMIYPPKQIQEKIVEFLNRKTSEIDSVISKIEKQIKLLDEYKASLIYHAVTGKMQNNI